MYRPDPDTIAVTASGFTMSWSDKISFCVVPSILHKILDGFRGILVVPYWPSQPWYPILARRLTQRPVFMLARENLHAMLTNLEEKNRLLKAL